MSVDTNNKIVTAIVPAYNEASRIGRVLEVLTTYPNFREIIVVDDASTDGTWNVAKKFDVKYIRNDVNRGKGYSMDRAVQLANTEIIFFCDADISGLTHEVIDEITQPVLSGEVDMFIGMRNRKWYFAHQIITLVPLLGGERALTKSLWQKLPDYYKQYFKVEVALNFYALYYGNGFHYKVFRGLSQVIKEKKYGLWEGTKQRWGLVSNVLRAQAKLQFVDIPPSAKNRRFLGIVALQNLIGMIVGALFLLAAYLGNRDLVITVIGTLIFVPNAVAFLFTFEKISYALYGLMYKIKSNKT